MTDPQPDLRTQLIAETRALEAQVDTCEHSLHRSPIGCPYCKRDTRFIALLRAAAEALASKQEQPPPSDKRRAGLYRKFDVRRTDGSDAAGGKHDGCNYFVLDITHDQYAIPALRAYAKACRDKYPALSDDLTSLVEGNPYMPYRTHLPPGPKTAEAAEALAVQPPRLTCAIADEVDPVCGCGTVMRCPDIGCDRHKAEALAVPSPHLTNEHDVIQHAVAHWFTQGGADEFGDIGHPENPDELVSAILQAVREKPKDDETLTRRDGPALTETPQPASSGWMPIETAPKDGSVLYVVAKVTSNQEPAVMWAYWNQRLQWWYRFAAKEPTRIYPTLFAPLPSPPQETV